MTTISVSVFFPQGHEVTQDKDNKEIGIYNNPMGLWVINGCSCLFF